MTDQDQKHPYVQRTGEWLRVGSTSLRVSDIDRVFTHSRCVMIDRGAKGMTTLTIPDGAQESDAEALAFEIFQALAAADPVAAHRFVTLPNGNVVRWPQSDNG